MVGNELEDKKKCLTLGEFEKLWNEQKKVKENWEYNIIFLKGRGNMLIADRYFPMSENEIILYYKGYKIGDLKLSIIKSIY